MRKVVGRGHLVLVLGIIGCLFVQLAWAADKTDPASAGKQLYQKGLRSSGVDLTANVGRASITMPASSLPCVGCHGRDGKGKPEGGVKPSNITWSQLSKVYGGTSNSGRKFGKYDEDTFLRVVTEGVDAAGNKLDASMPRYNISRHDARQLISYLKNIENEYDPGVSDQEIVFATLQPSQGWQAGLGETVSSTLQAYFDDINQQGGVYGRKLRLKRTGFKDASDFSSQARELAEADDVFAMLASFSGNSDQTLTDLSESAQIISIAPFTNHLTAKGNEHRYTFYIYGGLGTQIDALVKRAVGEKGQRSQVLVLYRENSPYAKNAQHAHAALQKQGIAKSEQVVYALENSDWTTELAKHAAVKTKIIFLGSTRDLLQIYPALQKLAIESIYLPGMLVSSEILKLPDELAAKVELSYHSIPNGGGKLQDFYRFMQQHKFGSKGMSMRLFAYSAARIAVEGLKRAGKRVSREKVITALEKLYDFDAGLNRAIRFGSSRRIGLLGAYMVKLDKAHNSLKSTGDWVALD